MLASVKMGMEVTHAEGVPARTGIIRVFIVDDDYLVRLALRVILEQEADIHVVGEADNGLTALERLQVEPLDLVLLDINIPGLDGIEVLRHLKMDQPQAKVLILTSYGDEYLAPAIQAGASGYMVKTAGRADLVNAVRAAARGLCPLDPQVTPRLLATLRHSSIVLDNPLSPREAEVLELMAEGQENKEIAAQISVSTQTVKNHVTSILRKLRVGSRTEAITLALHKRWVVNPWSARPGLESNEARIGRVLV